jgi:hypothetical protein
LTRRDIDTYINGRFGGFKEFNKMLEFEIEEAGKLRTVVAEKSSGVFLWVYVVVSLLLRDLRDGVKLLDLKARLEQLPPELDDLFNKILQQVNPQHAKKTSKLFQFIRSNPTESAPITLYWSQLTLLEALEADTKAVSADRGRWNGICSV